MSTGDANRDPGQGGQWFEVDSASDVVDDSGTVIGRLQPGREYRALDITGLQVTVPGPAGSVGYVARGAVRLLPKRQHATEAPPAADTRPNDSQNPPSPGPGTTTGTASALRASRVLPGVAILVFAATIGWTVLGAGNNQSDPNRTDTAAILGLGASSTDNTADGGTRTEPQPTQLVRTPVPTAAPPVPTAAPTPPVPTPVPTAAPTPPIPTPVPTTAAGTFDPQPLHQGPVTLSMGVIIESRRELIAQHQPGHTSIYFNDEYQGEVDIFSPWANPDGRRLRTFDEVADEIRTRLGMALTSSDTVDGSRVHVFGGGVQVAELSVGFLTAPGTATTTNAGWYVPNNLTLWLIDGPQGPVIVSAEALATDSSEWVNAVALAEDLIDSMRLVS